MINKKNAPHYKWGNNCDSWSLVDKTHLSIKQELMPPQTREKLHFHSVSEQFFFVLKGQATFYIDNIKSVVDSNNGVSILPNEKHFIANETDKTIEFLVISQPSVGTDRTEL